MLGIDLKCSFQAMSFMFAQRWEREQENLRYLGVEVDDVLALSEHIEI